MPWHSNALWKKWEIPLEITDTVLRAKEEKDHLACCQRTSQHVLWFGAALVHICEGTTNAEQYTGFWSNICCNQDVLYCVLYFGYMTVHKLKEQEGIWGHRSWISTEDMGVFVLVYSLLDSGTAQNFFLCYYSIYPPHTSPQSFSDFPFF